MKTSVFAASFILTGLAALGLAGCSFLKPSGVAPRSFVLTPLPATADPSFPSPTRTVGIGFVKLPEYLLAKSMAVHQGPNEIVYLETARWAERLDRGLQRVIAANLASLLPAVQARLSAWRPEQVSAEVYLTVEQFHADADGRCVLIADWRIVTPGGGEVRNAGRFRATRPGPAPDADPEGAALTMSELVLDLSRTLARTLDAAAPLASP